RVTTTTPASATSRTAAASRPRGGLAGNRRRKRLDRRSTPLTIAMLAALAYFLVPLLWLVVSSTKSTQDLINTFGLWFSHAPQLLGNIHDTLTQDDGVFVQWLLNTV